MNKKEYRTVGIRIVAFLIEDIVSTSVGEQLTDDGYALDIYKGGWQDGSLKK